MKIFLSFFSNARVLCIVATVLLLSLLSVDKALASSFVTTNGTNFSLDGKKFYSIGVNRYNLLTQGGTPFIGCGGTFTENDLATWFSELNQMGVTSVRFWLFQSFTKSGTDFSRFNYLLSLAKQYNIKVIPTFENQWGDCTQYGYKDDSWYQTGYLAPYGNYALSLKDYIGRVVSLYRDDPTILMWQIMNEAESSDPGDFYNFAQDVSSYIKSLDSNHLVSFGTTGIAQPGSKFYKKIHALASIDVLEYHDYNAESNLFPDTLAARIADAQSLNKPLFIGESGINLNTYTPAQRSVYFDNKMNAFFQKNPTIYMIWSYRNFDSVEHSFDFNFSDPLVSVIEKYTAAFQSGQPIFSQIPAIPVPMRLGGMDLNGYCASIGQGQAVLTSSTWVCSLGGAINMTSACQWQYPGQNATAIEYYPGNPYSWACYGYTSFSLSPTSIPSQTPTQTLTPTSFLTPTQALTPTPMALVKPTMTPLPTSTSVSIQTNTPTQIPTITSMPTKLGGMDLNGYCATQGANGTVLNNNMWYCNNSSTAINMNAVCQWEYNQPNAFASQSVAGNPYSWSCYSNY